MNSASNSPSTQKPRFSLGMLLWPVDTLGTIGIRLWTAVADTCAFAAAIVMLATRATTWRRTVRREFIRQCYLSGVSALPIIGLLGVLVGAGLLAQALSIFSLVGQDALIGQFLSVVVFREVAPALIGLVILGRSGSSVIADLGSMGIGRQLHTLDSLGVDPIVYLILPRVLGMAVSSVGLAMIFVAAAFVSGFAVAFIQGFGEGNLINSALATLATVTPMIYLVVIFKSLAIGLTVGVICCRRALTVSQATDLPSALAGGFIWGIFGVFFVSGMISLVLEILG